MGTLAQEQAHDGSSVAAAGPVSALIPTVARAHRTLAGSLLREVGLYPGQELLLMQLWEREPRSPGELARALQVEPPTAVKAVSRLEEAGFVRRERSAEDRRVVLVSLTASGRALRPRVEQIWAELERRTVGDLSRADRARLIELLSSISRNVGDVGPDPYGP
ncbi:MULTISPECIES: MarR family winged helix-turn-helix transcriptional regulator [unclassified Modestobacter]|uniref:MarR family winged helix-turn-helix transcriptional regulator n=1 Tax=unclassified Modestobacter TaxID=2643866 RepID=UPI0022AB1E2E|nr:MULTISPECIES: MarR family transcriptional regulator [unclassified Modestobacter]MCZ2826605.1 MarR family transcriptional regulator [Modestobacter sp. VKM Ac-2981]MCZ2854985.1 MarR family transcriptional regulator [Modestobacter sp. VKM Ac-2982]